MNSTTLSPGDVVAGPSRTRARPPSQPAASSKAAPGPTTRTLKQPMTLRVAESSIAGTGAQDKEEYFRALKRKAELARRVDKWMDRVMEETVDRGPFQKALSYMHAGQYAEVEHERHLNGLCSYPLCSNPPAAPYRAHKRFQISARAKTIKEVEGNADEGFCSKKCRVKSQWVRENLGSEAAWLRGKVAPMELLEDMEERWELVWEGGRNGQYRRVKPAAAAGGEGMDIDGAAAASTGGRNTIASQPPPLASAVGGQTVGAAAATSAPLGGAAAAVPQPRPAASQQSSRPMATQASAAADSASAAPADAPAPEASEVHDLLDTLVIRERDTARDVPVPPTLNPPPAQLAPKPPSATSARKARNTSSMIDGANSKLAQSVLTAHRQMKPVLQQEGDSEEEEGYQEQEWEKAMGWGEGKELEAMFEEARRARELAGEQ
ncbi:hypothetical protein A1Q1_02608 [Trichosporon asahii var. asahii CBS 2479]|uniref:RNA polymerase II subunit B1 CTD phosphatase RPAP2 homolog n=1 Tax=Trichosporon asahii var. asahii (strain ATCC 90039 / CBS 2479 / JCM 2466 / KCTC 7840 / NBRC 103889/ NCYC 2677 / UAMH 7654) TaxID=1186058 RepID=J4UBQ7_TRIAS|nr:hypothetical protein A1Q1_02608 [Trichosporon asahii var. asahii CBS 2479]EJT48325.1 hypothetical protein A1Q1_02608 [Trichosporon asahii var. asahii CBS 2479]